MGFPEFYRRAAALPDEKWLYMLTDEASTEEEQRRSVLVAKAIRIQESVMGGTKIFGILRHLISQPLEALFEQKLLIYLKIFRLD